MWLRAWQAQIGRVTLYLLDANVPATSGRPGHHGQALRRRGRDCGSSGNRARHRRLAAARRPRHRSRRVSSQRRPCGVRGARTGARGDAVTVRFLRRGVAATRAGNVFTTHTSVAAAFDVFPAALMMKYFPEDALLRLGIDSRAPGAGTGARTRSGEPFNVGVSGHPGRRPRQRRECAARRDVAARFSRRCSRAGRAPKCRSARHQRRARSVLGFSLRRRAVDDRLRARCAGAARRKATPPPSRRIDDASSGRCAGAHGASSSNRSVPVSDGSSGVVGPGSNG